MINKNADTSTMCSLCAQILSFKGSNSLDRVLMFIILSPYSIFNSYSCFFFAYEEKPLKLNVVLDTCFFICMQILIEFCAGGAVDAVMLGKYLFILLVYILYLIKQSNSYVYVIE